MDFNGVNMAGWVMYLAVDVTTLSVYLNANVCTIDRRASVRTRDDHQRYASHDSVCVRLLQSEDRADQGNTEKGE